MTWQLRRVIWSRLGLVAVMLATLVGGSVFLVGRASTARRVRELAIEEAQRLVDHARVLSGAGRGGQTAARADVVEHLVREHVAVGPFVVIELYDTSRREVLKVVEPRFAEVGQAVDARQHASLLRDTLAHEELTVRGEEFLQVFAPLRGDGGTVAYFEGVYRVGPDVVAALNRGVALSVVLVVLVVLAAVAVLYPVIVRLNGDLLHLSADVAHANMGLLVALGSAVAKRDRGTNAHNYRVTIYAARLAEQVGLSPHRIRGLIKGAFLHDVGKIAVVDAILRKPGRLTADEVAAMKTHVSHGVEIVSKFRWLDDALEVVECHHERFDGRGYPAGLRGEEIPTSARIFTIVDVFDALTTCRPYKDAAPLHASVAALVAERGTAFDPALLDRFVALAPDLHRTVCGASEAALVALLDRILVKYFSLEERRPRAAPPPGPRRPAADADADEDDAVSLSGAFWLDAKAPASAKGRAGSSAARGAASGGSRADDPELLGPIFASARLP